MGQEQNNRSYCASQSSTMEQTDKQFAGSIPEIYDRFLVPLLFRSYARDLAERVASVNPGRVLETAAGTGVLTREMSLLLPGHVSIVATDLSQPMIDYALKGWPPDVRVTWRQADALALPFGNEAFDVVACQFGVMFFPAKVQGFKEAHRVLKPGGHIFFNVWDDISQNEFAEAITQALAEVFPEDPPRFMARTPHGYHDVAMLKADLVAAGFAKILVDTRDDTSKAASPKDAALAYCQGTPLRNEIEARDASRLEEATQAAADLLARRYGRGPIKGRLRAHVVVAVC